MKSLKIQQIDPLPRTPNRRFMTASTLPLKAQRESKSSPFRPCSRTRFERFALCFPYFGAPLPVAGFRPLGTLRAPCLLLL